MESCKDHIKFLKLPVLVQSWWIVVDEAYGDNISSALISYFSIHDENVQTYVCNFVTQNWIRIIQTSFQPTYLTQTVCQRVNIFHDIAYDWLWSTGTLSSEFSLLHRMKWQLLWWLVFFLSRQPSARLTPKKDCNTTQYQNSGGQSPCRDRCQNKGRRF